ncbi:hypothetical protein QR685DRAFT_304283 [Neurospora intermedia]|uniref:Uncharacterized protein n=1 Tax=Neurospora intermedia TaxID=5142 RepID=A0ABR3DB58_NEUIN
MKLTGNMERRRRATSCLPSGTRSMRDKKRAIWFGFWLGLVCWLVMGSLMIPQRLYFLLAFCIVRMYVALFRIRGTYEYKSKQKAWTRRNGVLRTHVAMSVTMRSKSLCVFCLY